MSAKLCALWRLISGQKTKSAGARDGSKSFKEFIKPKCLKIEKKSSSKIEMETLEKKIPMGRKLALQDWLLASPGLKSDYYLMKGDGCSASNQYKKKVHPCSSRFFGSLISEAKDSLCLDRPMNCREEEEEEEGAGMSNCSLITRNLSGKSQKRVRFQLPHTVMFYSPDEPYCKEASLCSQKMKHKPYSSEDSFSSPNNCWENSFDSSVEEPFIRLAVDILPHVYVSSKI